MLRRNVYYTIKPFIPRRVRLAVRGVFARRKLRAKSRTWPIDERAGAPPEGWPGWPNGRQFALVLTHDVEGQLGLDRCRPLAELEMSLGFRSCFNFIPEGDYRVTKDLRDWLVGHGFEVGVHDLYHDGKLFRSREEFARNAKRINHYLREWKAVGYRSGFMLHNLDWQRDLEVAYDASTFDVDPFEPQPEGVGTIFPYWVPGRRTADSGINADVQADRPLQGFVELPYTLVQDSTLFLLLQQRTIAIWQRKLDWIAARGGMALVNVHPDYTSFQNDSTPPGEFPVERYAEFLRMVRDQYPQAHWHALPREVAAYAAPHLSRVSRPAEQVVHASYAPHSPALAKKRIAVFLYSTFPSDPRPRRAAQACASAGAAVDFLCLRNGDSNPASEQANGIAVTRIPMRKRRESKRTYIAQYSWFFLQCMFRSVWRMRRHRYDLVHVHNMPDFLVFAALPAKLLGAKVILDLHDPMPELMSSIYDLPDQHWIVRLLKFIERRSIGFADLVLTPNIAFRNMFVARGCPPEKIAIIMNSPQEEVFHGTRQEARHRASAADTSFRIMHHGFLVHRHGIDLLVQAVAMLREAIPGIRLDIFGGRTPFLEEVLRTAEDLQVADLVTYHGIRPHSAIAEAIAQCDLGVIPNRLSTFTNNNFPTRIFEYLAMECPVLVPSTQGICDYFSEQQILMFTPDKVDDLARKIQWAYEHPVPLREITLRGKAVYQQHLWSMEHRRFVRLTSQLLSSDHLGPPAVATV